MKVKLNVTERKVKVKMSEIGKLIWANRKWKLSCIQIVLLDKFLLVPTRDFDCTEMCEKSKSTSFSYNENQTYSSVQNYKLYVDWTC